MRSARLWRRIVATASAAPVSLLLVARPDAQSGLLGEYFNAATPRPVGQAADFARVDPSVDFVWLLDAPDGTTIASDDSYSERWSGYVRVSAAGLWTFITTSNDGAQLWVNGSLVVDDWAQHFTQEQSGTLSLPAPGWYPLRLEHYNQGGTAVIRLAFEGPGQARVIIPPGSLCKNEECLSGFAVDAGPDLFLAPPETSIELHASVRGAHVLAVPTSAHITWAQLSGPPALIVDPDRLTTEIVPGASGILRFWIRVTDAYARTAFDDVLVHVFGGNQDGELTGEPRKWHKLSLTFQHSSVLSETGTPNPFLDLRLETLFLHPASGTLERVPGFFAADGEAAETSASSGDRWRVNFAPDRAGTWYYLATFRSGPGVALTSDPLAGQPVSFDGASGSFVVAPANPAAPGFLAKGRLEYVGGHQLRFAETHEDFLKGGSDSPENFLGYYEFDNTYDLGGQANGLVSGGYRDGLHHFDAHLADFVDPGVSTWKKGKGQRIFGAIDYLGSRGVNSLYALTFNVDGGDGREVWPWAAPGDKAHFDVSKLEQWERVVDHMTRAGVALHLVTQETENEFALDGGELGSQRFLYYRELVAHLGHALGLFWNLGEENDNTPQQLMAFASALRELDPYDHPISVHSHLNSSSVFDSLLGSALELVSVQAYPVDASAKTMDLVSRSAAAGRPWVVNYDEQAPANDGVVPDAVDFFHDTIRKYGLWPNLLAQGGGVEWYFGYSNPDSDLDCENFRSRENMWRQTALALDFFRQHLPFARMEQADALSSSPGARVLAQRGAIYAVYLPSGGSSGLNLEGTSASFLVSWFDPRNGGALRNGTVLAITGPGWASLGSPPGAGDWVAFVRPATNFAPEILSLAVEPGRYTEGGDLTLLVYADDSNGPADELTVTVDVRDPAGNLFGSFGAAHRGGTLYSLFFDDLPPLAVGTWQLAVVVQDSAGASASGQASFEAQ